MFELTPENTADYLRSQECLEPGRVTVEALSWGVSNAVLRVVTPQRQFVVKQSRPRLRTKEDWFSDIDRVFREVAVMQLLEPLLSAGTVPKILFVDRENYAFGMAHAPADAIVWKESLLKGETDLGVARQAGFVLGTIHERTAQLATDHGWPGLESSEAPASSQRPRKGLPGLPKTPAPATTRQSKIEYLRDPTVFDQLRIDPFYRRIRERRPEVAEAITPLIDQMRSLTDALCHGDFSPKNFLVHPNRDGFFTLVDYETGYFGDPTMDLGFFLSHLILKAIKNQKIRAQYYALTETFWNAYGSVVRFKPLAELMARGIQHFAACALARIDGTSPVDYLPEEAKRESVRQISRRVLWERPAAWNDVLEIAEGEIRNGWPTMT